MSQHESVICNTSPIRYFSLVGHFDLLVRLLGGEALLPRQVLDPEEDPDGIESLISEVARSERYWAKRSTDPESMENWSRLRAIRSRTDISVVDLEGEELPVFAELVGPSYPRTVGLVGALGPGEAAVIAISENRGWTAALDDALARDVLVQRNPGADVTTTRGLLRKGVAQRLVDSADAQLIYDDMLAKGYRGPAGLWD